MSVSDVLEILRIMSVLFRRSNSVVDKVNMLVIFLTSFRRLDTLMETPPQKSGFRSRAEEKGI